MYSWFFVTSFGLPELTFWQMLGIDIALTFLIAFPKYGDQLLYVEHMDNPLDSKTELNRIIFSYAFSGFMFILALIVSYFI